MQFFSTITIAREHRKALFQDVQHASGAREATEDWEILADWYHWCASARADGTLDGLHPSTASMSFSLLHPREKAQPQQWLVVCQLLAPYTQEGSVLEWSTDDRAFFRFLFMKGQIIYQVGAIVYQDHPLPV